ncbi:MAG: M23 family metallopeptidase [Kiloniellales bacterium]
MKGRPGLALIPAVLLLFLAQDVQASGPAPVLELPLDCEMGAHCVVQNYVDLAPGPEAGDYTCGPLTYDGHKGTDIRVAGLPEMEAGVAVLAAAPGVVRAIREGMADVSTKKTGAEAVKSREAGNAVVITHEGGWKTQYSHMKRGSIAVSKGQLIEAGTKLGLIGLSGSTEFPHLEFSLRHEGKTIDPFTGRGAQSGCAAEGEALWSPGARTALVYRAGGPLLAGFAPRVPELERLISGEDRAGRIAQDDPALVFWAVSYGLRKDDKETIRIIGPDGRVFAEADSSLPKNKAQWMRFVGKRLKADRWPPGVYRGEYRVTRSENGRETVIVETLREIEIR